MDKILSKDTIKNVFSALGAKTSDSNYGVALLDKTSGEPKGLMGMSDLASVLGGQIVTPAVNTDPDTLTASGVTYQVEVNSSEANYPFSLGYAIIKNEKAGGSRLVQNLYHIGSQDCYSRTRDNAYYWTPWQRLDNFGCNTAADLASLLGGVNGGASAQYKSLVNSRYIYNVSPFERFPAANGDTIQTDWLRVFFTRNGEIYFETYTDGLPSGIFKVTGTAYNPT